MTQLRISDNIKQKVSLNITNNILLINPCFNQSILRRFSRIHKTKEYPTSWSFIILHIKDENNNKNKNLTSSDDLQKMYPFFILLLQLVEV